MSAGVAYALGVATGLLLSGAAIYLALVVFPSKVFDEEGK